MTRAETYLERAARSASAASASPPHLYQSGLGVRVLRGRFQPSMKLSSLLPMADDIIPHSGRACRHGR